MFSIRICNPSFTCLSLYIYLSIYTVLTYTKKKVGIVWPCVQKYFLLHHPIISLLLRRRRGLSAVDEYKSFFCHHRRISLHARTHIYAISFSIFPRAQISRYERDCCYSDFSVFYYYRTKLCC